MNAITVYCEDEHYDTKKLKKESKKAITCVFTSNNSVVCEDKNNSFFCIWAHQSIELSHLI